MAIVLDGAVQRAFEIGRWEPLPAGPEELVLTIGLFVLAVAAALALAYFGRRLRALSARDVRREEEFEEAEQARERLSRTLSERKEAAREREELLGRERDAREEAEHARAQAEALEQRLHDLVEGLNAVVWEADAESWEFTFVSERAEQILGYPPERWLDDPDFWANLVHPQDRERVLAKRVASLREGRSHELDYRAIAADGAVSWLHDVVQVVRGDDGEPERLRGVMVDISERKRAESELAERVRRDALNAEASALLASSLDYETTLESVARLAVPDFADYCLIDVVADDGRTLHRLATVHSDAEKRDLMGELERYPPVPGSESPAFAVLETGEPEFVPEVSEQWMEAVARSAKHLGLLYTLRPRSVIIVPLHARGHTLGLIWFVRSGSEARYGNDDLALAEELARRAALAVDNARLYRESERAVRARDEVLSVVSHDLRDPLGTISTTASLLLDTPLPEEQKAGKLEIIKRATGRMNRLIQDLLDVARVEAGRLPVEPERQDAAALAEDACESLRPKAEERSLTLECELAEDLPPVRADHDRMLQVFSNLVGNAIKFTDEGGRIGIAAEPHGDAVRFSVSDTGRGIAEEDLEHLFDRFWQAEEGARQGAGLGLAITKGIVEAHGGRIHAESEIGVGTTFYFTLPAAGTEPRRDEPEAEEWVEAAG